MLPIFELLNQSKYYFYFLVVDEFLDIKLPELNNLYSISPQSLNITLREKNSGLLLSHPTTQKFINDTTPTGFTPVIIPFKPSSKLEIICHNNKWILAANQATLNRYFEDKIKFTDLCYQNGLPQIPNLVGPLSSELYSLAESKFGLELVAQTHFGWAGNSTHLAKSFSQISQLIEPNTVVKLSPLLTGYSLLNNCCLTSAGLIQSPPALQYTGLPEFTQNPFATVGRQWPCLAPTEIQQQVRHVTEKFSTILQSQKFRGFFGLDFFVNNNQVYLLECNPRLTASFAFYTEIEMKHQLNPLFLLHLIQFLDLDYSININQEASRFYLPDFIGSELTQKNSTGTTIKKFHNFTPFTHTFDPVIIDPTISAKFL
ncbi:ATP-grasp domain-containing protein [Candidatus Shapirobacteria bacterium]|nr:ATP-grasp domain-containing protein [Candidatus Shapirobacteria bacterium]